MVTSTDIVNQALQLVGGNQALVTGVAPTFDNSTAGVAASLLYVPAVQTVARQFGYDFSRNTAALVASGNAAPFPFAFEFLYPTSGIQVRQLTPAALADKNNPLPINWTVANALVGGVPTKVIHTNLAAGNAVFTNQPTESTWDPLFREAVVRLLASELAMAIESKPDTSRDAFEQSNGFEQVGETRDS
jgi:hypothetical protein